MKRSLSLILLLITIGFIVFGNTRRNAPREYDKYLIDSVIDLHQDTLVIPKGRLVKFTPKGIIQNGVVIFPSGDYFVEATSEQKKCIVIGDNTEILINGDITLLPNGLNSYNVLYLKGENINVRGTGSISGDKFDHIGKDGEWGHSIQISGNGVVSIKDVTVKNCWGDCLYIRGKDADVTIDGCTLDHGRRQGVSITSASSVMIRNTVITNVSGKSPQYAVDVEPNANDTIQKVVIKNVHIKDCKGGIVASSRSKNSNVGYVEVENCFVEGHVHYPYYFSTLPKVSVKNCKAGAGRLNITYKDVKRFIQSNNEVVGFKNPVTHKK